MSEKEIYINTLINKVIDASIKFEALMDSTDFDSWLENDSIAVLKKKGQEVTPFKNFNENKKALRNICSQIGGKRTNEFLKGGENSSLEKYLTCTLFKAKIKRLNARISSDSEIERSNYEKILPLLFVALNRLQKLKDDLTQQRKIDEKYWHIVFYNELSICYAGLGNSSISRGYAEEAKKIIEKEKSYKEFDEKLGDAKPTKVTDIEKLEFVSSKLYDLYIVSLFSQAEAERRSYLYTEAEKHFKKIINYAEKYTCLINFNYYSALVNLSDLYIDQGRGKEALEFLKIVKKNLDENDIRYWKASLEEIAALIDQSEYDKAKKILIEKFLIKKEDNRFSLKDRHKLTSQGFKGLNHFVRCQIEKVRNTLKMSEEDKKSKLKKAENVIEDNIRTIKERNQKQSEKTAYKYLGNIYERLENYEEAIKKFIEFLSEGEIDDLKKFARHEKMEDWINECEDLNVLEDFSDTICKLFGHNGNAAASRKILRKLKERIKKECEDRDELFRAERIVAKIDEVLEEEPTNKIFWKNPEIVKKQSGFFDEKSSDEKKDLNGEDIRKRLDINEKKFDEVLFERTKIKSTDHIVEVIVLRRWNSFSPGLFRKYTGSLGGGYLLRINKKLLEATDDGKDVENIVIDPGYNFLQNFCSEGFNIEDIDTIIVTHSHLDHCAELLPIMDLIYQINKRYENYRDTTERPKKRINLCLSSGAYRKFSSYTLDPDWQKQLKDVNILEKLPENKWSPFNGLTITAIPTHHMDLGGVNAIGLKIEIDKIKGENNEKSERLCLGFTSDTPWYKKIKEDFKGCDVLCVHLGSIKYQEIGYTDERYKKSGNKRAIDKKERFKKIKETYIKANHLLFFGTDDIMTSYDSENSDNLIIVGEFGEELKYGLRIDLCKKLSNGKSIDCFPGDIGLYIGIGKDGTKKVRCNFCDEFVGQKDIRTFSYGKEDAIHYICQTCHNTLSELQKQAFVEYRVTRH